MIVTSAQQLRKIYGWPSERARKKVLNKLEKHTINFIGKSPFFVLSSYDQNGKVDSSPRGGHPGFVKVLNPNTILIPDAKGNNRVDSLINIVQTGRIGCLFLIPGIEETLRINGSAQILTDEVLLNYFPNENIKPITCIKVNVQEVFLHCAKAFMRSELWEGTYRQKRPDFPTMGSMLKDHLNSSGPHESQDEMIKRYRKDL